MQERWEWSDICLLVMQDLVLDCSVRTDDHYMRLHSMIPPPFNISSQQSNCMAESLRCIVGISLNYAVKTSSSN